MREVKVNEYKHEDSAYDIKQRIASDPSLRFVASPLLDRVFVTIYDADLIKQFLNKESLTTIKYTGFIGSMSEFLANGLVFTEGEHWKRQRKLISQVFHFDYMNNSLPTIKATVKEWIEKNCKGSSSSSVNVSQELKMFTSTVIWRILFGEDKFDMNHNEIVTLMLENLALSSELNMSKWNFIFGPWFFRLGLREIDRKYMRDKKKIKEIFFSKLAQLREKIHQKGDGDQDTSTAVDGSKPKYKNLIELLLEQAEGLPDLEIVSQIFTFFFAGTDTTSELLTMAHYFLATHPEAQEKLREEVLNYIGKTEDIRYEHISKMEYLNAVIKETLRIGSPVLVIAFRTAIKDFMLSEVEIKKGTVLTASPAAVANNPKIFSNPEQFKPERWIEKTDLGTIETSTHLPFSAGARRCIGEQLALIESKVMLCELIRRFKIELKTPYKLKMGVSVVYHAKPDLNVIYTPLE